MNVSDLMVAKDRSKVDVKEKKLDLDIKPFFKGKKYFLRTYGCQMNVHDSEPGGRQSISASLKSLPKKLHL